MDSKLRTSHPGVLADRLWNKSRTVQYAAGALLWLVLVGLVAGANPTPARASAPVEAFSITPSTTQAGGHPNITTLFELGTRNSQHIPPPSCDCQDAKVVSVDAPTGVIADPHATPQCTAAEFGSHACPVDSQIGMADIRAGLTFHEPVYNLVPHVGQAGLIGINIGALNFPIFIVVSPRTESDYGLNLTAAEITHLFPLELQRLTLWGVPADPSHDAQRVSPPGCDSTGTGEPLCTSPTPSNSPLIPLLDNPTTCGVALSASIHVLAYDEGLSEGSAVYPATTGCDQLSFNPSLFAQPTTEATDTASGLAVDLHVPQQESPSVPSPSEIRAATVTLPQGFSINPNAADGKTACSDSEALIGTQEEARCSQFSKIGTLSIESSALPGPLPGYVYIGEPQPNNRYRIVLAADGFGVHVKIAGRVSPDPQTGQLVISFVDLPQSPFSDFNIHLFGSERGLLATPTQCGTYQVNSTFTPWDSELPNETSSQSFVLDSGPDGGPCPGPTRPFTPAFNAGVIDRTAGAHAGFSLELTRPDGDQTIAGLTDENPPGFGATLKGIPYCPEAALESVVSYSGLTELSTPSCPAASQIGTATAGAGAGTHPVFLGGKVYLAGPYKGAPLSLAVITPAVSGPYDLGNVVVRAALDVDRTTAQVTAHSDPLPQILDGIPLRLRSIVINLDRNGFTLNPTNCDPLTIAATVTGSQGATADPSSPFQMANCAVLPFTPKLSLKLGGSTTRTGTPSLTATLTAMPGEANISSVAVTLPPTEQIDNAHIGGPCTKVAFAANNCPASSVIGFATAETPLLEKPLEGPVYLRSAPENASGLPDVVAALRGQLAIDLDGKIKTVNGKLRTTFAQVPDTPVTSFRLTLKGGKKSLLQNNTNLCKANLKVITQMRGQNGKSSNGRSKLLTPCSPKRGSRRASHHRHSNVKVVG